LFFVTTLFLTGCALVLGIAWRPLLPQHEPATLTRMLAGFTFIWRRKPVLGAVSLDLIFAAPGQSLAAFEAAYAHEQYITGRINDLVKLAREEDDTASEVFLQWYVTEQVEEEASADEVLQKLKLMAGAPGGLYMLDQQLGQRSFTPPSAE